MLTARHASLVGALRAHHVLPRHDHQTKGRFYIASENLGEAASCRMSCLEKRLSVGDSERNSVKSGSVKPFTTRQVFAFVSPVSPATLQVCTKRIVIGR